MPTDFPTPVDPWADSGSAQKTEPPAGLKTVGFVGGQHPPANFLNWILGVLAAYTTTLQSVLPTYFVRALDSVAQTITGIKTFSSEIVSTVVGVFLKVGHATLPKVQFYANGEDFRIGYNCDPSKLNVGSSQIDNTYTTGKFTTTHRVIVWQWPSHADSVTLFQVWKGEAGWVDGNAIPLIPLIRSTDTPTGPYAITVANHTTKKFTIAGDYAGLFPVGRQLYVVGSTGNDKYYTVVSATYVPTNTEIVVSETMPDTLDTADGNIYIPNPLFQVNHGQGLSTVGTNDALTWATNKITRLLTEVGVIRLEGLSSAAAGWVASIATTAGNLFRDNNLGVQSQLRFVDSAGTVHSVAMKDYIDDRVWHVTDANSVAIVAAATNYTMASISVPAGKWMIIFTGTLSTPPTVTTVADVQIYNSTDAAVLEGFYEYSYDNSFNGAVAVAIHTYVSLAATKTIIARVAVDAYGAGSGTAAGRITAVKVGE